MNYMYVIVGLGNPGKKYENSRHNIGFNIIDVLSDRMAIKVNKIKHQALIGEGFFNGEKVMLVKPQTYMNKSGEAVRDIVDYYDVNLDRVLIIYDDVDTDVGSIRMRIKGSGGSHNGMNNVIYHLKTKEIPRLRVGIGQDEQIPLRSYVLGKFRDDEIKAVNDSIQTSVLAIEEYIKHDIDLAMNKYNG